MNEVFPWSPAMKQYHRANMHLFRLTGYELRNILTIIIMPCFFNLHHFQQMFACVQQHCLSV